MVYNGYYKVMSNIPKMGHLTAPELSQAKSQDKNNIIHTIYKPPMLNGFFLLLHLRSSSSTRMFITSW